MNLTKFLIRNKFTFNLLAVFIILAGLVALFRIPRDVWPPVNFDIVSIRTPYAGATAEQIEKLITYPLEKELKEVDDIKEMNSISAEGYSLLLLVLEPDAKNKDRIVNEIQRAVDRVEDFPDDLKDKPVVRELKSDHEPIMEIALSGPTDQLVLQDWAKKLEDKLLDIPEVTSVLKRGYYEKQFHVLVDPEKVLAAHVSLVEVARALEKQNINRPGGSLYDAHGEWLVRTTGEFKNAEEIKKVVIRSNDQGHHLTVGDVAAVNFAHEKPVIYYPAVILQPVKKKETDIFVLKEKIQKTLDEMKEMGPSELHFSLINDFSYYVERRLNVLRWNGIIGFILVMIPLFLFFSPRMALGTLIGMPTAFLATIAVMQYFGITINLLSMFGLIMVIGMLVDEDIVIAENIHRLLKEGKSYWEATVYGTQEVTKAVIATVLTTITAFLPLLMMTGIMGKFVRQIPIVVIITLIASLIEALIILPVHIYTFNQNKKSLASDHFHDKYFGPHVIDRFGQWIRFLVAHRYKTLLGTFVFTSLVGILWFFKIHFVLFPSGGIEQFFVRAKMPTGTSLEIMADKMKEVEALVATLPKDELDHMLTEVGISQNDPNDPFTKRSSNVAQIAVFLTPESKRDREAREIIESLRVSVNKIKGFEELSFDDVNPGPPVGKPVAVRLKGENWEELEAYAEKVKTVLRDLPGISDVVDDFDPGKNEKRLTVNRDKVAQSGLTLDEVATSVRLSFDGLIATTIKEGDEDIDVLVRYPEAMEHDPKTLEKIFIPNKMDNLVPLMNVMKVEEARGVEVIRHFDRRRTLTVSAELDQKLSSSSKITKTLQKKMKNDIKNNHDVTVHFGGEYEETGESLKSFYQAFGLALLLTFIILAATVTDPIAPFIILATIIFGLVGVGLGFLIQGEPLSFLALLGLVGMSGIVVDVGLLIVDFIHKKRDEGLNPYEAIIEGTKSRLRPIVLTNLTTLLGIIPASIGLGGRDPFIQPMAMALNWGIGFGSLASLFFMPVAMAIAQDFRERRKKKLLVTSGK